MRKTILTLTTLFAFICLQAQKARKQANPVYIDARGTMRWTATKKEASFFGVNYTVPFAYGYRSHKALGIDPQKAIDADVAHMARLGFNAFRVHVWDTEISDSAGNLLNNEHLRLFDYLLLKLKERGIKILITPLAFWGNGYPEPDQNTGSFSSIWNKQKVVTTEAAIKAQEAYLQQFFRHVNPYTGTTYGNDPDVIAMEINNEPHHTGPQEGATQYVNRMVAAVRSTGWTKPIFYNISESPAYAAAVVKAKVDGHSFQWYPTGLVANHTLQGNYLPHVDRYHIPFVDTIPAFKKRALMVYEFDAGDVLGSYMYPAMARAFRGAGFQWATQFAYDPLYTAHANTEYQTHYVNLAYTPSKALSLMIAGKVFQRVPRFKNYGAYPADTLFDSFRVFYAQDLSEMNTPQEFIYSNETATRPVNAAALRLVAGVGSSPVVQYDGTGAYFLDKIKDGVWRLEVLPDVFQLSDPFAKASPQKMVRRLQAGSRNMRVSLPDLAAGFEVVAADGKSMAAGNNGFAVTPGVYYLKNGGAQFQMPAPQPAVDYPVLPLSADSVLFTHTPATYASAGGQLQLTAQIAGADSVTLELRHSIAGWRSLKMQPVTGFTYSAAVPAEMLVAGPLEYRILAKDKNGGVHAFPGDVVGDPYAWDALPAQTWKTVVLPKAASIHLFDAAADGEQVSQFTPNWEQNRIQYSASEQFPYISQLLKANDWSKTPALAWQLFIGDKIKERSNVLSGLSRVVVKGSGAAGTSLQVVLATENGQAYAARLTFEAGKDSYEIPLSSFAPAPMLLLPRPYPGFQPLTFSPGNNAPIAIDELMFLQVNLTGPPNGERSATLQRIYLQ